MDGGLSDRSLTEGVQKKTGLLNGLSLNRYAAATAKPTLTSSATHSLPAGAERIKAMRRSLSLMGGSIGVGSGVVFQVGSLDDCFDNCWTRRTGRFVTED